MRSGTLAVGLVLVAGAAVVGWPRPSLLPEARAADGRYVVQDAWPGATFQIPVAVAAPRDGSERLFVVERPGRILVGKKFRGGQPAAAPTVFLDIRSLQMPGEIQGHGGLLNLAFPPNFAQTGQFVVFYGAGTGTAPDPYRAVVASYRVNPQNPNVADPASGKILIQVPRTGKWSNPNHFGGGLAFGPDGMLYVGLGDSAMKNDSENLAQDTRLLAAKILRIDVNSTSPGLPYGIPKDNPWSDGRGGVRGEIFAYGVRNPWRIKFDASGALWMGDLGQQKREKIAIVQRAGNMGWPFMESDLKNLPDAKPASYVPTIFGYGREMGSCVIGGVVYRGQRCPALAGSYVFADNSSVMDSDANKTGKVFALPLANGRTTGAPAPVCDCEDVVSVDEDAQGEIYFSCLATGTVKTLVPAP